MSIMSKQYLVSIVTSFFPKVPKSINRIRTGSLHLLRKTGVAANLDIYGNAVDIQRASVEINPLLMVAISRAR